MRVNLVMTVIGPDKTGLVDSLASVISENGGNWEESRMSHLAGRFAGLLRVSVAPEDEATLTSALEALGQTGLSVVLQADREPPQAPEADIVALDLIGHDRPGIVSRVSKVLARNGVNVEEISTTTFDAPMSGERLFQAKATLRLPPTCPLPELRTALESLAGDLMVDLKVAPASGD